MMIETYGIERVYIKKTLSTTLCIFMYISMISIQIQSRYFLEFHGIRPSTPRPDYFRLLSSLNWKIYSSGIYLSRYRPMSEIPRCMTRTIDCNLSLTRCRMCKQPGLIGNTKSRTFINGRDKTFDISDFHMDHDSYLTGIAVESTNFRSVPFTFVNT